jgi:tetratricopeptide (TPR) repeat protein
VPQLAATSFGGQHVVAEFADPFVQLRTMAAAGARYLVMAATGNGVAPFQEPPPVLSWTHPYWLAALPVAGLLGWRLLASLRRRRAEAAWWLLAAAAFAPISQIMPFYFSIADRYLYFILPGLLGGVLSWWYVSDDPEHEPLGQQLGSLGRWLPVALALALAGLFARESALRAPLWSDEPSLITEAARHYPKSGAAQLTRACDAARVGDVNAAVEYLDRAIALGYLAPFELDPRLAPIRATPEFAAMLRRQARATLDAEAARGRTRATPVLLRSLAAAHVRVGENDRARELLERGIRLGGPRAPQLRADLLLLGRRTSGADAPP